MKLLSIFLAFAISACSQPQPPIPPGPVPQPTGEVHAQLLDAHNAERSSKGLTKFVESDRLVLAAQRHSDHMAKVNRLGHFGIGDGTPSDRLNAVGYEALAGGENVGAGQRDISEIMRGWMASSGHRKAILGTYKEYGGAVATSANGTKYWTSCFGTPARELRVIGGEQLIKTENGFLVPAYEDFKEQEK